MIVVVTFLAHVFLVKLVYNFSSSEIITWLIEQVRQELKFDVLHLSSYTISVNVFPCVHISVDVQ
jgi:hypothetical protein